MRNRTIGTNPVIREIRPEELALTAQLRHEMNMEIDGSDYEIISPGWRDRYMSFFGDLLRGGRGQFFVAESEGELIGSAAVYKLPNHRAAISLKHSAYVCTVYVQPEWRRRGIARELVQRTIEWARQNGCEVVRLRTSPLGRPVYEGMGFGRTDELEMRLTRS